MPFISQLIQRIDDTAFATAKVILFIPHFGGNAVRSLKADAPDVVSQTIRIPLNLFNTFLAVFTVDFGSIGSTHSIALQEEHYILDVLLFLPTLTNLFYTLLADTRHIIEFFNIGLNHVNSIQTELLDDELGELRTDAFDQSTTQVLFDAIDGSRHHFLPSLAYKLASIAFIHLPVPFTQQHTSGRHLQEVAHQGNKVIVSFDLDSHD
ncbi:hypothetical protein EVA_06945 [gut metagenome]|uniref:Uncharacterized protein n=1 Tax=gut metagenome TaxID=749906 RepID=J9GC77_9ZZZZ